MDNQQNDQSAPPCPCPCRPRIEALEALVQDQGRQLAELNLRIQNAAMSFCCDIAQILPLQNVAGPFVQQPVNEGTTAEPESTATAASNEEETTEDFSSQTDHGDSSGCGPFISISIKNTTGAQATGKDYRGNSDAPSPMQPPPPPLVFADVNVETKPVINSDGSIQNAKVSTKKKRRIIIRSGTESATGGTTTTAFTKKARKVNIKPCRRFRCKDCTASYYDQLDLTIHARIHEKNMFGLGPDLKTCDRCGLQMVASESPNMHSEMECQVIRQSRIE